MNKILIINRHSPPEFESSLINCMINISRNLIKKNIEVHILGLTHNPAHPLKTEWEKNIFVHRIYIPRSNPLKENFTFVREAYKYYLDLQKKENFSLINIHESRFPYLILKRNPYKIPVIYTFHASVVWEYSYENIKNLKSYLKRRKFLSFLKTLLRYIPNILWLRYAEKSALKYSNEIHCASSFVRSQVLDSYEKRLSAKIKIIPFGVDYERFTLAERNSPAYSKRSSGSGEFRIFCLRRLVHRMGLESLIRALAVCKEKYPEEKIKIRLGGKGYLQKDLETLTQNLSLNDDIEFSGFIPDEDLPSFYRESDLFVLPTEELEGFGLVILEAWACGIPVLGSNAGAIPEILNKAPAGFLFPINDTEKLCESIHKIRELKKTGKIPSAQNIRKYAMENYSWKNYVKEAFLKE